MLRSSKVVGRDDRLTELPNLAADDERGRRAVARVRDLRSPDLAPTPLSAAYERCSPTGSEALPAGKQRSFATRIAQRSQHEATRFRDREQLPL